MEENGYGRYIDEGDGLPRWNLPPRCLKPWGLKWEYIEEAVRELYPDHGARFVTERLGIPSSRAEAIMKRANSHGIRMTKDGRRRMYVDGGFRKRRIFKMERARVLGGMPQVTRLRLGRGGVILPHKLYSLRNRFVAEYGYYYCEGDAMVLLYDGKTRRRLPGIVRSRGFTEDDVTRKYGITFERVDDEEEA